MTAVGGIWRTLGLRRTQCDPPIEALDLDALCKRVGARQERPCENERRDGRAYVRVDAPRPLPRRSWRRSAGMAP